jgi:hypothetical protein
MTQRRQPDLTPPSLRLWDAPPPVMGTVGDYADRDRRTVSQQTRHEARADALQFPGAGYAEAFDRERLTGQLRDVFDLMADAEWRTLGEIKAAIGKGTETGLSAALRSLRHKSRGAHRVDKQRRGDPRRGLWEYRLVVRAGARQP